MRTKRWAAILAATAMTALALTACSSGSSTGGASCQVKVIDKSAPEVTVWAWYPHFDQIVNNFNKSHKDVQVCWSNVGAGGPEYTKLSTAIQAGSGAPDVVMLETDHVPQYVGQKGLVDLTKYGIDKIKGNFADGTWKDETVNGGIYAVPVDGGPVGLLYRKDIFEKYGLTVPTTWAEYAADAAKLKAAGSTTLMTDFQGNGGGQTEAMLAQAGGPLPFTLEGKTITIQANSPQWQKVIDYWGDLVSKKLVGTEDGGTTDYNTHLVNGTYASVIAAAWLPGYLIGFKGADKDAVWASAPLPQWDQSKPVSVNIGGSAFSVTTQAKDKKLAAEVAEGIFADQTSLDYGAKNNIIFPLNSTYNSSDAFVNLPYPFFAGQTVNKDVFVPALDAYEGLPASPFQEYFYDQLNHATGAIISGKQEPSAALATVQSSLVKYAKDQGYTVKQ
jgi:multiple sugar transport system substrate-binding protein